MSSNTATLCAITAIIIWSSIVALMRSITLYFGSVGGAALIYSISAALLLSRQNFLQYKCFPKKYLWAGGFFFVAYEILLSQAIGLANDSRQTLEIGLINYLWPCLVVLFAIPINRQKAKMWLLLPGILLSFSGIVLAMCSGEGFSITLLQQNILSNPVAYLMVFTAAIFWGLYCNISKKYGQGKNAVSLFCFVTAILLWSKFFLEGSILPAFEFTKTIELLIAGLLFGSSYWLWETGIQKGHMMFIAILSYFTPLFSTAFSCLWLVIFPGSYFWYGTCLVICGAIFCWRAIK